MLQLKFQLNSSSSAARFVACLAGLPNGAGLISAVKHFRLGLSADPFCLGHQKSIDSTNLKASIFHRKAFQTCQKK
jgi:hypothetical protein